MKLNYRPEIDGLRAIVVFAVILYHADITLFGYNFFKGGYIGVDVFFVISGYLITSFILKELETSGRFSFLNFYERRARRILPALFTVMLVFLPFAWIHLLPADFINFSKSILYSIGFTSNLFFWREGLQYGAETGLSIPFLHTWSLSVEEQFYIFFPIALILCIKFFKQYLLIIMFVGILISLQLADWGSRNHPTITFYILPTRMWELLAGSFLAKLELNYGRTNYKILNHTLPTLGLLLIIHSIVFFDENTFHPSFYTVLPIIGTMLIIWFSNVDEFFYKIASSKIFVGLGLISYSLYLWHYPIFAFAKINPLSQSRIFIGALVIGLSIISYFLIEKPFRNRKKTSFKSFIIFIFSILILLILINSLIIKNKGFVKRIPEILQENIKNSQYRAINQNGLHCHNRIGDAGFCTFNDQAKSGDIYLLGDSITDSLLQDIIKKTKELDFKLIHMSYSANLYLPNFVRVNKKSNKAETTEAAHIFRKNAILSGHNNSYIVIAGYYSYYFYENIVSLDNGIIKVADTEEYFTQKNNFEFNKDIRFQNLKTNFKEAILNLANKNKKIILLYPLPESPENISKKIYSFYNFKFDDKEFKEKLSDSDLNIDLDFFYKRSSKIFNFFDEINHKNVYKIYPHKLFCNIKKI